MRTKKEAETMLKDSKELSTKLIRTMGATRGNNKKRRLQTRIIAIESQIKTLEWILE